MNIPVTGFVDQNGAVRKYDYGHLENVPTDLVKDADLDVVIAVQDTEPEEEKTKLWIKETASGGVQVPTYEELLEVKEDTDELKDDLVSSNSGFENFSLYGTFSLGGLYNDGTLYPAQRYRVSSTDHFSFDHDIIVHVESGYRWGYVEYTNNTSAWRGWYTNDIIVRAGTVFSVSIAMVDEPTIGNILEYVRAITFQTNTMSQISDLQTEMNNIKSSVGYIINDTSDLINITVSAVSNGWQLSGNGLCETAAGYSLRKYSVNHGDLIYFDAPKEGKGTFQFQSAANVPSSGTNSNLVGKAYSKEFFGYLAVPENAIYLIISTLTETIPNVQLAESSMKTLMAQDGQAWR